MSRHRCLDGSTTATTTATGITRLTFDADDDSHPALIVHQRQNSPPHEHPVSAGFAKAIIGEQRFVQQDAYIEIADEG